jgi:ElaB/YqjD/DUF883 family membrane-anchored ribosome-binding protein
MSQKSRAVNRVHEMTDTAADGAETVADTVKRVASDTADAVRERASDMLEDGNARASDAADQVAEHVKEHAGSSLLIAVGIGFLLGMIFGRRND